jgi:hypothetical protein
MVGVHGAAFFCLWMEGEKKNIREDITFQIWPAEETCWMCSQIEYYASHLHTQFVHSLLRMNGLNSSPMKKNQNQNQKKGGKNTNCAWSDHPPTLCFSFEPSSLQQCPAEKTQDYYTQQEQRKILRFSDSFIHSEEESCVCLSP